MCSDIYCSCVVLFIFFFNDTATTEIYTLSLHDALPIWVLRCLRREVQDGGRRDQPPHGDRRNVVAVLAGHPVVGRVEVGPGVDRKSTRLNSSHANISYAVFCLKKKIKQKLARISEEC